MTDTLVCDCGTPDTYHWSTCALVDDNDRHTADCRIWHCTCHIASQRIDDTAIDGWSLCGSLTDQTGGSV